jgi:hypothetical protein
MNFEKKYSVKTLQVFESQDPTAEFFSRSYRAKPDAYEEF